MRGRVFRRSSDAQEPPPALPRWMLASVVFLLGTSTVATVLGAVAVVTASSAAADAHRVAGHAIKMLEVTNSSRLLTAEAVCDEVEDVKRGIRFVLRERIPELPEIAAPFRPRDCARVARRLVRPLPPLPEP